MPRAGGRAVFPATWLLLSLIAMLTGACHAAGSDQSEFPLSRGTSAYGPAQIQLDWDKDAFLLQHQTNRFYTNGAELVLRLPAASVSDAHQDHADLGLRRAYGFRIGQKLYTPGDISKTPSQLDGRDRPYAAWLYAGVFAERYWPAGHRGRYVRLHLDIGCLGPCAHGEQTQRSIHALLGTHDARGWSEQVRGGFGVQTSAELVPWRLTWARETVEFSPFVRGELGTVFINAGGGAMLRVGRFGSPYDMAVSQHQTLPIAPLIGGGSEFFLFGRFWVRAIAYDATLQGGLFGRSPQTVTPAPLVLDTEWGVAYKHRRWALGLSFASRSNVLGGEPHRSIMHRWGRIQLAWQFD